MGITHGYGWPPNEDERVYKVEVDGEVVEEIYADGTDDSNMVWGYLIDKCYSPATGGTDIWNPHEWIGAGYVADFRSELNEWDENGFKIEAAIEDVSEFEKNVEIQYPVYFQTGASLEFSMQVEYGDGHTAGAEVNWTGDGDDVKLYPNVGLRWNGEDEIISHVFLAEEPNSVYHDVPLGMRSRHIYSDYTDSVEATFYNIWMVSG